MLKLLLNLAFCACIALAEDTKPIPEHAKNTPANPTNPNSAVENEISDFTKKVQIRSGHTIVQMSDYYNALLADKQRTATRENRLLNKKDFEDVAEKVDEFFKPDPFLKTKLKDVASKISGEDTQKYSEAAFQFSDGFKKSATDFRVKEEKEKIEKQQNAEKERAEEDKKRQERQQEELDNIRRDAENRMNNQADNYKRALNNKRDNLSDSLAKALQNANGGGGAGGGGGSSMENAHTNLGQGLSNLLDKLSNKFITRPSYNNNNNENGDKKSDTPFKLDSLAKGAEEEADDIEKKTKSTPDSSKQDSAENLPQLQDGESQEQIAYQAGGGVGGSSSKGGNGGGGGGGNNFGQGEKVVGSKSSNGDISDGVAWNSIGKLEPPEPGPSIKKTQKYLLLKPGAEMGEGSEGANNEGGGENSAEGGDDLFDEKRKGPPLASQLLPVLASEEGVKGLMGYVGNVLPQACITESTKNLKRKIARVCFHKGIQPRMLAIIDKREREK